VHTKQLLGSNSAKIMLVVLASSQTCNQLCAWCCRCDAADVYHRMDYDWLCICLLLELVCLLCAEATVKTSCSIEGSHGSCAVCHCTSR